MVSKGWLYISKRDLPLTVLLPWIPHVPISLWSALGVTSIEHLFSEDTLRAFSDLRSLYHIPNSKFFQYLQIRHAISSLHWPPKPDLPTSFSRYLLGSSGLSKGLSTLYRLLADPPPNSSSPHICRWERELSKHFPLNSWFRAAMAPRKFSSCINHVELMRKIHLRWYLTPDRLVHMFPSSSRLCWRGCGRVGSLLHMWWSCPIISPFWLTVQNLIKEITGLRLTLAPELVVLDIDLFDLPRPLQIIVHHILLAARISIGRLWKTPTTPSITELCNRVNLSCHSEATLTPFNPCPAKHHNDWSLWMSSRYYL